MLSGLFFIVFLLSIAGLIISFVKPSIFGVYLKTVPSKKNLTLFFVIVMIISIGVMAELAPTENKEQAPAQIDDQTTVQQDKEANGGENQKVSAPADALESDASQTNVNQAVAPMQGTPSSSQSRAQNQELKPQASWSKIKSWSGVGIKQTEPFEITGNQWRIAWANKGGEFGGGTFHVFVYNAKDGSMEDLVASATEIASDTSYLYKKGVFYLNISSSNTSWAVEVEELK